jgi:hypothetical protein
MIALMISTNMYRAPFLYERGTRRGRSACERIAVTAEPVTSFGGLFPVTTLRLSEGDFNPVSAIPQAAIGQAVVGDSAGTGIDPGGVLRTGRDLR